MQMQREERDCNVGQAGSLFGLVLLSCDLFVDMFIKAPLFSNKLFVCDFAELILLLLNQYCQR